MPARRSAAGDLQPIGTASRVELQTVQLKRLPWTLRHAYDHSLVSDVNTSSPVSPSAITSPLCGSMISG